MKPLLFFSRRFIIPAGIEVNGNFVSQKEGSIAGTINGDVHVKARLIVEKQGIINGDLHAKDLTIKGRVNGNIYCEGKVSALKDSVVSGNISAAEARIDKFSIVKGIIAHINQKKGNGSNTYPLEASLETPVIPDNFLPDEPPQNWF